MGVLFTFINAVNTVIAAIVHVYSLIVIGACLCSWVNADPYNPIVRFLRNITDPVLWRIRKLMPFVVISGLDLSPVVLLIGLQLLQSLISMLLWQLLRLSAG